MNKEFFIENNINFILEMFYFFVTDSKKFYTKVVEYYTEKGDNYYTGIFTEILNTRF